MRLRDVTTRLTCVAVSLANSVVLVSANTIGEGVSLILAVSPINSVVIRIANNNGVGVNRMLVITLRDRVTVVIANSPGPCGPKA